MNIKINIKNIVVFFCCTIVCLVTLVPFIKYTGNKTMNNTNYLKLDKGWTLEIQGESYQPESLADYYFNQTNRNDVVVLKKILGASETVNVMYPVLRLYSIHSTVEVELDGDLLYSYGKERFAEGKVIGYGYHYVALPSDYAGKELKITYVVTEDNAFNGIQDLELSDQYQLFINTLIDSRFHFAASIFLLVFGFMLSIITLPQILKDVKNIKLFSLSILSFLLGIWTLCNTDLILFFTNNLLVKLFAEYLSIYFIPIPLLLYFYDKIIVNKCIKAFRVMYILLLSAQLAFFIFACFTQLINFIHLPNLLTYAHILMALDLIFTGAYTFFSFTRDKNRERSYYLGTFLVVAFGVAELIRYNIYKYFFHFSGNRYQASLCIVALILIVALFYDYTKNVTHILKIQTQQRLLEELAYKDELTGLANRRKCDDTLETLLAHDFAVISMDLNNLKHYNDTYGHEKGDLLLKSFASVLKESFPYPMLPARTGGDEFFVLIPEPYSHETDKILEHFRKNIDTFNQKHDDLKLYTAIGVVKREEFSSDFDVHIVCQEVDRRMYANKRKVNNPSLAASRLEERGLYR